jgi:rhodanese-related sulfurtransferase
MLQRMGLKNVCGLQNGTSGWMLAGYDLEAGADRLKLPEPSPETIAQAEEIATAFAEQDGVEFISVPELQQMMDRRKHESIYLVDVRTREEYERGHIPGFRWFPGGQAVQRSDEVMVAHNSSIVFSCDGRARAAFTASWYRQMGHRQVYVLDGGTTAWQSSRRALEKGMARPEPFGLAAASARVAKVAPEQAASVSATSIHVGTSQEFASGHMPGARWISRSWLEIEIGSIAPDRSAPVLLTCLDGANSILAAATLLNMGYEKVTALQGGMRAWNAAGLPVEQGLTGVMSPPNDIVPSGPDRSFADMMNYLRWEEALGHKYETH